MLGPWGLMTPVPFCFLIDRSFANAAESESGDDMRQYAKRKIEKDQNLAKKVNSDDELRNRFVMCEGRGMGKGGKGRWSGARKS